MNNTRLIFTNYYYLPNQSQYKLTIDCRVQDVDWLVDVYRHFYQGDEVIIEVDGLPYKETLQ